MQKPENDRTRETERHTESEREREIERAEMAYRGKCLV